MSLYKLPSFSSVDDFLQKVATIRGKLKKGGIVDIEAAARIVLHDWNEGMPMVFISKCKLPAICANLNFFHCFHRQDSLLYPTPNQGWSRFGDKDCI